MKKLLLIAMLLASFGLASAQNYDTLFIQDVVNYGQYHYCADTYDGVVIYGEPNWNCQWQIGASGELFYADHIVVTNNESQYTIYYIGSFSRIIDVFFNNVIGVSPFSEPILWKRQDESVTLSIETGGFNYYDYEYLWSNGSTDWSIEVTEPGTYSVTITSIYGCGAETFSIEVRDNVEISLATCDLETNLNMVTWPTTPAQAEYVSQVEVKRDGLVVGTAAYSDGYFIDNIGSDAASRTYTVTALATDGAPCPLASYPKETIHMAYLTGINNTIEVNWNSPTGYDLLGYNICEWNAEENELSVIDYVGSSVTSYTCQQSAFDQGYIVVQGVEAGKDGESRLLSNRSSETVGLNENGSQGFKVYPNPTNGTFTVDGTTDLTVFNTLGQVITTSHSENGTHTFTLRSGIYFIKSDEGTVQKIVVE